MKIAVLGLGKMGQAISERLLQGGHHVTLWNRSKGKPVPAASATRSSGTSWPTRPRSPPGS
jgi:3-hydroxyisobutyrate dehydrogenase-like beta-hydroxyacid dehydrogenase